MSLTQGVHALQQLPNSATPKRWAVKKTAVMYRYYAGGASKTYCGTIRV